MSLPAQLTINEQDKLRKLFDIGYFAGKEWDSVKRFTLGSAQVKEAVEKYRDFHALPPSNVIDERMTTDLFMPRCGVPDFVMPEGAALQRWVSPNVTCAHRIEGLNPLEAEVERQLVITALASFSGVCGLLLTLIESMSTANIITKIGPQRSGILAHSFMPNANEPLTTKLEQLFGSNVQWSFHLLLQVLMHEYGHAVGLPHAPSSSGAIMQPTANGKIVTWQKWDIEQLQLRYGKPKPKPPEEPPIPPSGSRIVLRSDIAAGEYVLTPVGGNDWNFSPQ